MPESNDHMEITPPGNDTDRVRRPIEAGDIYTDSDNIEVPSEIRGHYPYTPIIESCLTNSDTDPKIDLDEEITIAGRTLSIATIVRVWITLSMTYEITVARDKIKMFQEGKSVASEEVRQAMNHNEQVSKNPEEYIRGFIRHALHAIIEGKEKGPTGKIKSEGGLCDFKNVLLNI
jgi:hypothetical protein